MYMCIACSYNSTHTFDIAFFISTYRFSLQVNTPFNEDVGLLVSIRMWVRCTRHTPLKNTIWVYTHTHIHTPLDNVGVPKIYIYIHIPSTHTIYIHFHIPTGKHVHFMQTVYITQTCLKAKAFNDYLVPCLISTWHPSLLV